MAQKPLPKVAGFQPFACGRISAFANTHDIMAIEDAASHLPNQVNGAFEHLNRAIYIQMQGPQRAWIELVAKNQTLFESVS